jgi:hypothetical protein
MYASNPLEVESDLLVHVALLIGVMERPLQPVQKKAGATADSLGAGVGGGPDESARCGNALEISIAQKNQALALRCRPK